MVCELCEKIDQRVMVEASDSTEALLRLCLTHDHNQYCVFYDEHVYLNEEYKDKIGAKVISSPKYIGVINEIKPKEYSKRDMLDWLETEVPSEKQITSHGNMCEYPGCSLKSVPSSDMCETHEKTANIVL